VCIKRKEQGRRFRKSCRSGLTIGKLERGWRVRLPAGRLVMAR